MKRYICRLLLASVATLLRTIAFSQDNYTISSTEVSFNYTKKTTEETTIREAKYSTNALLVLSGSNKNAPMVTNVDGAVQVTTKNTEQPANAGAQINTLIQTPFTTGMGNANYIKYSLLASKDASLSGKLFYKLLSSSDVFCPQSGKATLVTEESPKNGIATVSFNFQYDPINKIGIVNVAGSCASSKVVSGGCDGGTKSTEDNISAGVGITTDMSKSMYGYGMKPDPNAAYMQLVKTKTGYRISYHKETKENNGARTVSEDLTAYIGQPEEQYEAVIMPYNFDYTQWLPTGPKTDGSDDTKGDVAIQFYVDVHKKGDPTYKYPGMAKVSWNLANVTNYPGFCNNYPKFTGTGFDTSPDLVFNADMKQSAAFANGSVAKDYASSGSCNASQALARIVCMDYAAWGKLSAVVVLDDGTSLNAVSSVEPQKNYVTLPLDKDENKLADAWEEHNNPNKHVLTWDEDDQPTEQRENGDGYTLFEEYRGFAAITPATKETEEKTIYVRTDPTQKDAFICDIDGLFKKYYEDYNPAKITWHYLSKDKTQLIFIGQDKTHKKHRWINFNTPDEMLFAHQYAMVLIKDEGTNPCAYGDGQNSLAVTFGRREYYSCNDVSFPDADTVEFARQIYDSPQQGYIETVVYIGRIRNFFAIDMKGKLKDFDIANNFFKLVDVLTGNTVRHEIGHYLGITHHDSGPRKDEFGKSRKDFLSTDGVADCLMRYENAIDHFLGSYWLKEFSRYCKRSEIGYWWEFDPKSTDENMKIILKPYTCNDNCFEQITVKSKPSK